MHLGPAPKIPVRRNMAQVRLDHRLHSRNSNVANLYFRPILRYANNVVR